MRGPPLDRHTRTAPGSRFFKPGEEPKIDEELSPIREASRAGAADDASGVKRGAACALIDAKVTVTPTSSVGALALANAAPAARARPARARHGAVARRDPRFKKRLVRGGDVVRRAERPHDGHVVLARAAAVFDGYGRLNIGLYRGSKGPLLGPACFMFLVRPAPLRPRPADGRVDSCEGSRRAIL